MLQRLIDRRGLPYNSWDVYLANSDRVSRPEVREHAGYTGVWLEPWSEQFVNFSFRSVHFVRMKLQFSSIPYSPTIGHGDRSVRLVEFDPESYRTAPALVRAAL